MHRSDPRRRQQRITTLELVCVLVVLLAVAGLVVWILTHRGGVGGFLGVAGLVRIHAPKRTSLLAH